MKWRETNGWRMALSLIRSIATRAQSLSQNHISLIILYWIHFLSARATRSNGSKNTSDFDKLKPNSWDLYGPLSAAFKDGLLQTSLISDHCRPFFFNRRVLWPSTPSASRYLVSIATTDLYENKSRKCQ